MYVTHTLTMDLSGPAVVPKVDMVQRDRFVRKMNLVLQSDGDPWEIPEHTHAIICYQKADGTGGEYDTLPDGRKAYSAEGNVLSLEVAPQVLTKPGPVRMAVDLLLGDAKLSTFMILLYVQKAIPLGLTSEDYFKLEGFLPIPENGEMGQLLRIAGVSEAGQVTGVEGYDVSALLEEARDSGLFDGKSAYQIAVDNGFEGTEAEWLESLKGKGISAALGNIAQINITGQLTTDYNVIVDFNGSRLRRVKDPVEDTDGVNKAYVDRALAGAGGRKYPESWDQAVAAVRDRVNALQNAAGRSSFSFLWFSDLLIGAGEDHCFGALGAALMDRCRIPVAILSGGAVAEGLTSEEAWVDAVYASDDALADVETGKLLRAQGVSDGAYGTGYLTTVEDNTAYSALFRRQEEDPRRVFGPEGSYFYLDQPHRKVRFLVLNCCCRQSGSGALGYGAEQIRWLADDALVFPESGWSLVLVSHVSPEDSRVVDGEAVLEVVTAFHYSRSFGVTVDDEQISGDFTGAVQAEIVGFFCGGTGEDTMNDSLNPFYIVTIRPGIDRTAEENSTGRYAMDVVTVDPATKFVNMTRLGPGTDRMFLH